MSYRPSRRSVAITVIALTLLGSGIGLLARTHDTSSGAPTTIAPAAHLNSHETYGLPPSQPHEFTLTSDGQ